MTIFHSVPPSQEKLRVLAHGWPVGTESIDVKAVCISACECFGDYFSQPSELEPIQVERASPFIETPMVLYGRTSDDYCRVLINLEEEDKRTWAKIAFQFSHELCHIASNFKARNIEGQKSSWHQSQWVEEAICHTASLYAIQKMSETWKEQAPYPNWGSYAASLESYFGVTEWQTKLYAEEMGCLSDSPQDINGLIRRKLDLLTDNPCGPEGRKILDIIALNLLPFFNNSPEGWSSIRYLNLSSSPALGDHLSFLSGWHEDTPEDLRPFVNKVSDLLTVTPTENRGCDCLSCVD